MKVPCRLSYVEIENDDGLVVESVEVICSRCNHDTQSFGTSQRSINRSLALLNDECPKGENNFYEVDR